MASTITKPPVGMAGVQKVYGKFKYVELAKGAIDIEDTWERDKLITVRNVLGLGVNVRLHHLVVPNFEAGLRAALGAVPQYKVRMLGGFCPRHKMHDKTRGLSIHSWGAAFDVNWDTNGVGKKAPHDIPEAFVKAFEHVGWEWGGRWNMRDWMHFQYCTGV